jgi:hypothetical protein
MTNRSDPIMSRLRRWLALRLIKTSRAALARQIERGWNRDLSLTLDRLLLAEETLDV